MITPILITIIGILLIFLAFASVFFPILPGGPILAYLSVLLWYWIVPESESGSWNFSFTSLVLLGIAHIIVIVGDFLIPLIGGKIFNFSKKGIWGSLIGMVVGLFFFPPFGVILGTIVGTFVGEIYHDFNFKKSLRITTYTTLITMSMFFLKAIVLTWTTYYFITAVWNYYL